jgi:AraC-like DNA-binding protein
MLDPLSDVFSLLEVRSARCKRFEAGGEWAMRFPEKPALKFAAVLRGACWIVLQDQAPAPLVAGDTFLLANAPSYVLASDPALRPEDGFAAYDAGRANSVHVGGDDTVLISGEFVFEAGSAQLLLDALPAFVHVPTSSAAAAVLRDTLVLLDSEMTAGEMGRSLMMRRLADIALVQVLRAHVSENGAGSAKWIGALTDRRIAAALTCIHHEPSRRWTVGELATAAGMSRSGFAKRFRELVGAPPLDYLMRWRMERAREALRRPDAPLRHIALDAGYASESAFGFAFKRVFGCGPRQYWPRSARDGGAP